MLLFSKSILGSVPIGGSKIDQKDVGWNPDLAVIRVVSVHLHASSLNMLSDFIVSVDDLVVINPGFLIQLYKNVIRLNVSVYIA